ncbi:hypothetical protein [Maricaulis sp.]|uniref:hypothetical protein n=1 Tax=Maricaulis sp. TaxID=1486257 RepID=UPI000C3BC0A8|nr:hypothetical protein [Maricaulis sp.]MAC87723.1 hypothetical protein [Maricaulis sp.]
MAVTALILATALQGATVWTDAPGEVFADGLERPEARAYDFWLGEWTTNWRPRDPDGLDFLAEGSHLRQHVYTMLDGKALVEFGEPLEVDPETASGRGISIRYLDGETGQWIMVQNWPTAGFDGLALTDQLMGPALRNRIQLYSHDAQRATPEAPVIRRYTFSDIHDGSFRWEGASTTDAGHTWQTWTIIDLDRIEPHARPLSPGTGGPGQAGDLLCPDEPHGAFDGLAGNWSVTRTDADGGATTGRFEAAKMLDGCAVGGLMRLDGQETFLIWSWSPILQHWVQFALSDRPGERHRYAIARAGGEAATFSDAPDLVIGSQQANYYDGFRNFIPSALARWRWETVTEDAITVVEEMRADSEAGWTQAATYTLTRMDG